MKAWTVTNHYVEVITDSGLVKADIWFHGTTKCITVEGKDIVVSRLK